MEHDAWLLDFDGTLYTQRWVRLAMALELALAGWAAIPTLRAFRREHEHVRRLPPGPKSPYELQLEHAANALSVERAAVERVVSEWMIARPGRWLRLFRNRALERRITEFRARGGKTAVVSDYPATRKLEAMGYRTMFEVVVASGEPGGPKRLKPSPEGYLAAAERLGVAPGRCLVIGDRDDADGQAARSAGMAFELVR